MLVLERDLGEEIVITCADGKCFSLMVTRIESRRVALSFDAPREIKIHRREVQEQIDKGRSGHGRGT